MKLPVVDLAAERLVAAQPTYRQLRHQLIELVDGLAPLETTRFHRTHRRAAKYLERLEDLGKDLESLNGEITRLQSELAEL